jgi:formylglycine-generating enzyme required for sulfatase activity
MRQGLCAVARGMMLHGRVRGIGDSAFRKLLAEGYYRKREPTPEQALDLEAQTAALVNHSGLLEASGSPVCYTFSHLGFQEFLAAASFAEDPAGVALLEPHFDDSAWREVVLLTGGYLLGQRGYLGTQWARAVLGYCQGPNKVGRLELLARALADAPRYNLDEALTEEVTALAADTLSDPDNGGSEADRVGLGMALGQLGDPRVDLARRDNWVWIPDGMYTMGSEKTGDSNSEPVHQVMLSQGFFLARFLVTNTEFAAFIEAGGYQNHAWWDDAGRAFLEKEGHREPDFWSNPRFSGANQPVVGVSWHEAVAYCRWLSARWVTNGPSWWRQTYRVSLPTEAQWEAAASGREARPYPWGMAEPGELFANYAHNVGKPSPVGVYPQGKTPDGLADMGGNVWEWCSDIWDEDAYKKHCDGVIDPVAEGDPAVRCLRGGAWINDFGWLAAAFRSGIWAGLRNYDVGFRCCVHAVSAE